MFFSAAALFLGFLAVHGQDFPVAPYWPAQLTEETQAAPITVQYPHENMTVSRGAEDIYLFGKLNLKNAALTINGQHVDVHPNGTFIAFLPVQQGEFAFHLIATDPQNTYHALRHILVPGTPIGDFEKKARFDEREIYPSKPLWVMPQDTIFLSARGTANAQMTARLSGLKNAKEIPMQEDPKRAGFYRGKYVVAADEKPRSVKVTYFLHDPQTQTKAKINAPEKIKILTSSPLIARVKDAGTKLRQIPVKQGSLYPHYRAFGEVLITGKDKGLSRLQLSNGETAWLEDTKLKFLSNDEFHTNKITEVSIKNTPSFTQIRWTHSKQTPLFIQEFSDRLELSFYHTSSFEENFNFDATSPILERIEWNFPKNDVIKFVLFFKEKQSLWGYAYRYEQNDFVVELNHQPSISPSREKPLSGARILLDAGHSPKRLPPYDGLVTPSGLLEYELNLQLAQEIKPLLENAGATVLMTRQENNHIGLTARYKKALQEQAHIFVSLHYNALPETMNPLAEPRGYSIYYAYPHSFKLAESIYNSFSKSVPLPDNGMIIDDVLFIPRIPDIPSILIENAFPILPEQEDWVQSQKGRQTLTRAIYQGILDFYQSAYPAH